MGLCPCGCGRRLAGEHPDLARRGVALRSYFSPLQRLARDQEDHATDVEVDLGSFAETGETLAWLLIATAHGNRYVDNIEPFLAEAKAWEETAQRLAALVTPEDKPRRRARRHRHARL